LKELSNEQAAALKRSEARDSIRLSITQDTEEEKLRYLLEKYVVRPKLLA